MRPGPGRTARVAAACVAAVVGLSACGSDIDLPDITLPDSTSDITPPDLTPPDITLPGGGGGGGEPTGDPGPTPTGVEPPVTVTATRTETLPGRTETATQTETVTVAEPAAPETTPPPPAEEDESAEEEGDEGGLPWWVWVLGALALLALVGWLIAQRSAANRARRAWTERVDAAVGRMGPAEDVLRRPATLEPADQEAVRRAVAELRDLSVTFGDLSSTAPDAELAQETASSADALRALATSAEVENEGLASGRLASFEERQAAEARRITALQELDQAVGRLTTRLAD